MEFLSNALAVSIGVLQLGTVIFLLFGPIRKYAFVLAYCLLQLGTSLTEIVVAEKFGHGSKSYRYLFWTDELVLDVLLFFILILLTHRAMDAGPARARMGRFLGGVALIVMLLPQVLFKGAFVKMAWFDHTSQLLNFGGAILNLGLWSALLGSRKKDMQLLTVSAGFGIIATGVAICFGLRQLIHPHGGWLEAVNLIFVLAHLAGAAILCWAFRPSGTQRPRLVLSETNP